MKKFIYLIQSESNMPYPNLPDEGNDIILLTWKRPSKNPKSIFYQSIFYPGSSWNEGRNRLLSEAIKRSETTGNNYKYYIFIDGDCIVSEDKELAKELNIQLTGNPFRTFEKYLLDWEPAVGYTRYSWQYYDSGKETNIGYNIDAIFNAFHRETLSFLLPYYTGFDSESWFYSQHLINHLMAMLYNSYRIQFNIIKTKNIKRQRYEQRKRYWSIPTTFLVNAIKTNIKDKINVHDPNTMIPNSGEPKKKDCSYVISESFIKENFDIDHPFIKYRRLDAAPIHSVHPEMVDFGSRQGRSPFATAGVMRPTSRIAKGRECSIGPKDAIYGWTLNKLSDVSSKRKTAVCISGQCTTLDKTYENIQQKLLNQLDDYDLFMYVPKDDHCHKASLLNPTVLKVEKDHYLDDRDLINGENCRFKAGVQPYLQQLYGLRMCNNLRLAYEKEMNTRYDCVIRCRPDIMFLKAIDDIETLDLDYICLPDFHQFDGCNDRFAIGNSENMNVYFNKYDNIHDYVHDWLKNQKDAILVSAEMFTIGHLRNNNIKTRTIPIRFNRVRDHGMINDTSI